MASTNKLTKPSQLKPPMKIDKNSLTMRPPELLRSQVTAKVDTGLKSVENPRAQTSRPNNLKEAPKMLVRPGLRRRSKSVSDMRPLVRTVTHPNSLKPIGERQQRPASKRATAVDNSSDAPQTKKIKVAKPAPYDYKARFNLLLEKHNELKQLQKEQATTLETLLSENNENANNVTSLRQRVDFLENESAALKNQNQTLTRDNQQFSAKIDGQNSELEILRKNSVELTKENETLKNENRKLCCENMELGTNVNVQSSQLEELREECSRLKVTLDGIQRENNTIKSKYDQIFESHRKAVALIEEQKDRLQYLSSEVRHLQELRKVLHNNVQDLKGNIRVYCRIRPSTTSEVDRMLCCIDYPEENKMEIRRSRESVNNISGRPNELKLSFSFDKIFTPENNQHDVFEELSQLVQSALDGFDVCVFAYGQTGSGKTYTMQGDSDENNLGVIPRSIDLIFEKIADLEKSGWMYMVEASFLEIYNETLRDLLNTQSRCPLEINYNQGKGTTVANLTMERTVCKKELMTLMERAHKNRAVAATDFNEHSSRSHAVTKIRLCGRLKENESVLYTGSLNLVDLAGSECIKTSAEERIQETKAINKSLSTLGTVMLSLYNKKKHVPYRDSKLTYLLQSSLGGSSKTLMFVNISPLEECYVESVNSLRFATKVKEVKTSSKRNKLML